MKVCVLGAGTMGRGIAHSCAVAGHDVSIRDVDDDILADAETAIRDILDGGVERDKLSRADADAALARLEPTTSLADAAGGADVAVEAVPERESLKATVLQEVEAHLDDDALIGSNTSSIPVTGLASELDRPERFLGLHFFNPVHIMDLVEIVVADQTAAETVDRATSFIEGLDKEPVIIEDAPGFASSRLGVALGLEAIRMVEQGVASPADIDTTMELGYRHPMGPLELTDVVGLDVRLDIAEAMREELGERFKPPALLRKKVRAGKLGKKSGEGFYVWEDGEAIAPAPDFRGA